MKPKRPYLIIAIICALLAVSTLYGLAWLVHAYSGWWVGPTVPLGIIFIFGAAVGAIAAFNLWLE